MTETLLRLNGVSVTVIVDVCDPTYLESDLEVQVTVYGKQTQRSLSHGHFWSKQQESPRKLGRVTSDLSHLPLPTTCPPPDRGGGRRGNAMWSDFKFIFGQKFY